VAAAIGGPFQVHGFKHRVRRVRRVIGSDLPPREWVVLGFGAGCIASMVRITHPVDNCAVFFRSNSEIFYKQTRSHRHVPE
jgi:hypothetical protein